MRLIPFEQRSPEWFQARLGIPTASSFDRLITSTGKPSASADNYINQLVAERVTGVAVEVKVTDAMQRGIDLESQARSLFEFITDLVVTEAPLCLHDILDAGASPDAFIGDDALLEIKCPSAHTHVEYLRDGCLPSKYIAQVQGQLWITGKAKAHFLSYHPGFKPLMVVVNRNEVFITKLETEVVKAVYRISDLIKEFAL